MSEQLKLWFFRDLTDEQRLKLFGLFGLPVDEIGNVHGLQTIALRHIVQKLIKMVGDEAQPAPADKMAATEDQREAWMDGDTTGAYVGTEASKRLPLKVAPAEHVLGTDLIAKIAETANGVGWQAGEPAMELAGQIVSVLAAHPEHIERFMAEGTELFLDGTFNIENGSLTYRALNGSILSPSVIRKQKGQQQ